MQPILSTTICSVESQAGQRIQKAHKSFLFLWMRRPTCKLNLVQSLSYHARC